ncbi:coiled-coil domain-containing protein 149 isoform X2 [Venturia canescens]|uniref:coiled-coil domain-containing protein 149 isoform X2 n=1 Tax=Venturia canescens TaxID=32260 RepID=UPI001C9D30BF|nr:coiled-coil domain-containing protein 149 isoform X2 [Venturia canescens]
MARATESRCSSASYEANSSCNDNYNVENTMLRKKLHLQSESLNILSQELDQCRNQRDQYKWAAEQIQVRLSHMNVQSSEHNNVKCTDNEIRTMELLMEAREVNKCLRLQVETLKQKLGDARADIKVLRATSQSNIEQSTQLAPDVHQREEMIEQLEKMNIKCTQLQTDLQTVLDEKHELETERDAFKCKAHRLNHELSKALSATTTVDFDALINENRFLQERLQQLQEEKELARQSLSKYKGMLDSKRTKGTIKLGGDSAAGTVMTYKQVEQLLQQATTVPPQKSAAAISDLRRLCTALLETLNDKTLALVHQKKANKILASRICELDNAVQSPTMKLLEGYVGADVDSTVNCDFNNPEFDIKSTASDNLEKREDGLGLGASEQTNRSLPSSIIDRNLHPLPIDLPELPKNLGDLVEKALLNLRDNDKDK